MKRKGLFILLSTAAILGLLLTGCGPKNAEPVEDIVFMATWEYGLGSLADGASIKDAKGVKCYIDKIEVDCSSIPPHKPFAVKRTDPELGEFVVVSTTRNSSKIKFAKHGPDKCPSWAEDLLGSNCTATEELSIHGK